MAASRSRQRRSDATPVDPGLLARVAAGLRYAATGVRPADWFGPGEPPAVTADPSPVGRQFDLPPGWNLQATQSGENGVSFRQLRELADRWDLLRLVIETRKDQLAGLPWQVRSMIGGVDDPRIAAASALLRVPDGEHGWAEWLRMLLEDMFVLDAAALYLRRDERGGVTALEPIDGATLKRVLAEDGRTPPPPYPAYQQILRGVAAVDYSADELLYMPRNPRPHRVYGLSPVEQILMTVMIALNRQSTQLAYYTEGNSPEALVGAPDKWDVEHIRAFQEFWDAEFSGRPDARRRMRFVPGGFTYIPLREAALKDEFDEWLARVLCFAFSIPPTALVRQNNRATAETAHDSALEEGLAPLMQWVKGVVDRILQRAMGWADLEFAWVRPNDVDPAVQAQIDSTYVAAGIKTPDEVRQTLGLPPLPPA